MKLNVLLLAGAALFVATGAQATVTTTLYDQTNIPDQNGTLIQLPFYALSTYTALSFAGYNLPRETDVTNAIVQLNGVGANLLTGNYTFTPAPSGSLASRVGNNLYFAGVSQGSYDTYSTNFASAIGSNYTLSFNLLSAGSGSGNGLRITATNALAGTPVTGAVPEPASWAMMILGMGAVGFALRRQKVTTRVQFA